MKLLIVRHADPDYSIDSLTPTGWEEAKLLAQRLKKLDVESFYVSPLGRARDTASLTLQALGREATVLDWLQEFPAQIQKPNLPGRPSIAWDWLPQDWTADPKLYHREQWLETPAFSCSDTPALYAQVTEGLDALLKDHGYVRQGNYYRAERPNTNTVVLFCHFGLECVLLSHLLGVSPMVLWHGSCAAPSSVTTLTTEERREGIALFRMNAFGDTSHLYCQGREPSFSARFCEVFSNTEERHD